MDGEPLNHIHGSPLRVLMPGIYGMKTPKWLTRIELVDKSHLGYWVDGMVEHGRAATAIRDRRSARQGADFRTEFRDFRVGCHEQCWRRESGNLDGRRRHVESVPNFQQSEAVAGVGVLALRVANPPRGKHEIQVRATDANGKLQTASHSGEWPDGATGYHTVAVEVV